MSKAKATEPTPDAKPGPYAYTYDPDANPEQATLPGVPLDTITVAEWEGYPEWLQSSIVAIGWYTAVPPQE